MPPRTFNSFAKMNMQRTFNGVLITTAIAWQLCVPANAETKVNGTPITDAEINAALLASK
ncbi:hypothetical protein [Burkholderia ubonensis]|uniref:hypothetical protein n=1 Tax=Burkholderia ubonensis TaxID=101571 RepID=UPI000AD9208B|nr:hypothetical protein [Burkholderia ubonensis]